MKVKRETNIDDVDHTERRKCYRMKLKGNIIKYCILAVVIIVVVCLIIMALNRDSFRRWRNCEDSDACRRLRNYRPDKNPFRAYVIRSTEKDSADVLEGKIINNVTKEEYVFKVHFLEHSTIRLTIHEATVYRQRFQPNVALVQKPSLRKYGVNESTEEYVIVESDTVRVKLLLNPAKLEVYHTNDRNTPAIVVNDLGRFVMEYNQKETGLPKYKEEFDGFVDPRPYGPMAVAMDFSFPKATNVYGLSQHLARLSLSYTKSGEPYRLFNIDYASQKSRRRSMYGAVPFAIAHGVGGTAGIFWFNSADTWIDIDSVNETLPNGVNTYFISETGLLDVFLMAGPKFSDVTRQYSFLTGAAPLPPYFSLGYHQSRWNYYTQKEVLEVANNFDKYGLPLDTIWLDIEYTDEKRYFTWNSANFPNPKEMVDRLAAQNRKLVIIIDPHLKVDSEYKIYKGGIEKGLFLKKNDGKTFVGRAWPKDSVFFDFLKPEARDYWASQYLLENFKGTTNDVFIWNDMNEPSLFNGEERTLPRDLVHEGGWEHRDIHNIYSLLQVQATYEGLLRRSNHKLRPFILTRSHFAGSQRYAAIWTGDNYATWSTLSLSLPMCLSAALCGFSFCGADIGGFFDQPEPELILRWFQFGAYMPFMREHSDLDSPKREPYVYLENGSFVGPLIKEALQDRQILLPFWYTLFYQHSVGGQPVIRPLVMEFPEDTLTFDMDYEYLVGNTILVRPVTEPNVSEADVYFPGTDEIWYLYHRTKYFTATKPGARFVSVGYDSIPVFIRGGHIVPRSAEAENNALPCAKRVLQSNITLYIAPNKEDKAEGYLYIDDGETFDYQNKSYLYVKFEYDTSTIRMRFVEDNKFPTKQYVTGILIAGRKEIEKVSTVVDGIEMNLDIEVRSNSSSWIRSTKGELPFSREWTITLT